MRHVIIRIILLTIILATMMIFSLLKNQKVLAPVVEASAPIHYQPTHQQEVWRYVLEWCESRGVQTAVNPNDRDNTPSYYSFQWKPSTFRYFGEKYGLIEKGLTSEEIMEKMKDYGLQVLILNEMIGEREKINWTQQFPDCVRKYGPPPSR